MPGIPGRYAGGVTAVVLRRSSDALVRQIRELRILYRPRRGSHSGHASPTSPRHWGSRGAAQRGFHQNEQLRAALTASGRPRRVRQHWSLKLLAERFVEKEMSASISLEPLCLVLRKRTLPPPESAVSHSTGSQRRVRGPREGPRPALRWAATDDQSLRGANATGWRGARAACRNPCARRSDTPVDVTDASWRTTKLSSGGLLKRKPTKNSIEAAVCCSRWFGGLAGAQRSEYRPRSRLGGPSIESSSTDGLFLFQ
jgi:hypothetical protein